MKFISHMAAAILIAAGVSSAGSGVEHAESKGGATAQTVSDGLRIQFPAAPKGWPLVKVKLPPTPENAGKLQVGIRLDTPVKELQGGISLAPDGNRELAAKWNPFLGGKEGPYLNGRLRTGEEVLLELPWFAEHPVAALVLAARRPGKPATLTITRIAWLPKEIPGENLLMNGAMDSEQSDFPPFWYTQTPKLTRYFRSGGPDGQGAVVLTGDANLRQQGMILAPGEKYRLSGRFRTKNFKAKRFGFVVHNFAWQRDIGFREIAPDTQGWIKLEMYFTLIPSSTASNAYGVALHISEATGELAATDLKLEPLSEGAKAKSSNPMAIPTRQIIPLAPLLNRVSASAPTLVCSTGKLPLANDAYECRFLWRGQSGRAPIGANGQFTILLPDAASGKSELIVELWEKTGDRQVAQERFQVTVVTPPQVETGAFRQSNNLVTEILRTQTTPGAEQQFFAPRDGWIHLRQPAGSRLLLDGKTRIVAPEMFQHVTAGRHTLLPEGTPGELLVRSIPEIFCYPTAAGGWDLVERSVLGNATTFNRNLEQIPPDKMEKIRKTGAIVLSSCAVRPTEKAMLEEMAKNRAFSDPDMSGFTSDECFFTNPQVLAEYTRSLGKFDPKEKLIYTWIVGKPSTILHTDFMSAALNASQGRGRLLYEAYCIPYKTEEEQKNYLEDMLAATFRQFKRFLPISEHGTGIVLGVFARPGHMTLNSIAETDYKYVLDMQMNLLANHPEFRNLSGVGYWGFNYADEELIRWGYALLRHYAIEGRREMLSDRLGFRFNPDILKNGDFEADLQNWSTTGKVRIDENNGYRNNSQKRWGGGNRFCVLSKKSGEEATIRQTVRNLTPGRKYALQFITANLDEVKRYVYAPRRYGIDVTVKGGAVAEGGFVQQDVRQGKSPSAGINWHKLVLTAEKPEMEITFSNAAAAEGEELIINFIQMTPYFEEEQ